MPRRFRPRIFLRATTLALGIATAFGLAAPALSATPASAAETASSPALLLDGYQELLDDFATVISVKGEPFDARFDYEKLYDAKGRYERMARIKKELFAVPPSQMDSTTRLAWAINVYNFTVIRLATENLLIPGKGRQRYRSVRDIAIPNGGFFRAREIEVEGGHYSLDDFERKFCFAGWSRMASGDPPPALDPRVHFAIVNGARGGPPLMPRAYRPDSLHRQLEAACRASMALSRNLRWNDRIQRIEMSSLFHWNTADFGGRDKAMEFARRYAPAKMRGIIDAHKITTMGGMIPWDWDLNQPDRKKEL